MNSTVKPLNLGELINKSAKFLNIHDAMDRLRHVKEHGLERGLSTGWAGFDQYFTFPPMGQLNVVTGSPGSGKSEWVDSLALNMAAQHKWKIFYYSPENYPAEFHLQKLMEKFIGNPAFETYSNYKRVTDEEINLFEKFLINHFSFIDCHINASDIDSILNSIFLECMNRKVNMAIIDPWNKLDSQRRSNESETDFIGHTLTRIQMFARAKGISFWVIAHPAKPGGGKKDSSISLYDISGSSHWYNMTDNGFILHRSWKDRTDENFISHCRIAKIKDRRYGKFGEMDFVFNPANGRYTELVNGKAKKVDAQENLAF